jgi:predicted phosphohydrolase
MTSRLRLAFTADMHWGARPQGDEATGLLADFLRSDPPDVLVIAGDVGAGDHFGECLAQFHDLSCRKALVPGNHDIWVTADDERGDSLQVYREHLPRFCRSHGFHYLDHGPLLLPEVGLAIVGSINWYDYSWSLELLRAQVSDWEERLRTKHFTRGRHNDVNFVRWPLDDVRFTAEVVSAFRSQLQEALAVVERVVVVTHHPPFYGLSFDRPGPPTTLDSMLWDAFGGNRSLEAVLSEHAERIAFAFCGHTHRARQNTLHGIRGYNIGGDYHFKRLLLLDWPAGIIEAHQFGDAGFPR